MTDDQTLPPSNPQSAPPPPSPIPIIDFLAIFRRRKKPRGYAALEPKAKKRTLEEEARLGMPARPGTGAVLDPHLLAWHSGLPRDAQGRPVVRSQIAHFLAEQSLRREWVCTHFSFDDDKNAEHFIARLERAGLPELAEPHRKKLAQHHDEIARGLYPYWRPLDQGRDATSEALLSKMYGSPEEDRARILRCVEAGKQLLAIESRRLPPRANACELV